MDEARLVMVQKEVEKSPSSLLAGPWSLSFVGEVRPGWDEAEMKKEIRYKIRQPYTARKWKYSEQTVSLQ